MAGKAVYRKLAKKFGAEAAKKYLYGALSSDDSLSMVGKIGKIEKFYGHEGFRSNQHKASTEAALKKQAEEAKKNPKPDEPVLRKGKFEVNGKMYNGFVDQYGDRYVGQPNGGLVKLGK